MWNVSTNSQLPPSYETNNSSSMQLTQTPVGDKYPRKIRRTEITTERTIFFQISPFYKHRGCDERVIKVLHELGGVRLLDIDHKTGKLRVLTGQHPETILVALKREFSSHRIITMLENTTVAPQPTVNFTNIAQAMATAPHLEGLEDAEYTQTFKNGEFEETNTLKLKFTKREKHPTTSMSESGHNDSGPRFVGSPVPESMISFMSILLSTIGFLVRVLQNIPVRYHIVCLMLLFVIYNIRLVVGF